MVQTSLKRGPCGLLLACVLTASDGYAEGGQAGGSAPQKSPAQIAASIALLTVEPKPDALAILRDSIGHRYPIVRAEG